MKILGIENTLLKDAILRLKSCYVETKPDTSTVVRLECEVQVKCFSPDPDSRDQRIQELEAEVARYKAILE